MNILYLNLIIIILLMILIILYIKKNNINVNLKFETDFKFFTIFTINFNLHNDFILEIEFLFFGIYLIFKK